MMNAALYDVGQGLILSQIQISSTILFILVFWRLAQEKFVF
jgi:hypothetical protein